MRGDNFDLLHGLIVVAKQLQAKVPQKASLVARNVAFLSSRALLACFNTQGDTYTQLAWALMDAHSVVLECVQSQEKAPAEQVAQRCEWLIALVKWVGERLQNSELNTLYLKVRD